MLLTREGVETNLAQAYITMTGRLGQIKHSSEGIFNFWKNKNTHNAIVKCELLIKTDN